MVPIISVCFPFRSHFPQMAALFPPFFQETYSPGTPGSWVYCVLFNHWSWAITRHLNFYPILKRHFEGQRPHPPPTSETNDNIETSPFCQANGELIPIGYDLSPLDSLHTCIIAGIILAHNNSHNNFITCLYDICYTVRFFFFHCKILKVGTYVLYISGMCTLCMFEWMNEKLAFKSHEGQGQIFGPYRDFLAAFY